MLVTSQIHKQQYNECVNMTYQVFFVIITINSHSRVLKEKSGVVKN